jgi:hypothetical protein
VSENDVVMYGGTAQVEVAIAQAEKLVYVLVFVDIERWRLRSV